jgi:hypothetical protein
MGFFRSELSLSVIVMTALCEFYSSVIKRRGLCFLASLQLATKSTGSLETRKSLKFQDSRPLEEFRRIVRTWLWIC